MNPILANIDMMTWLWYAFIHAPLGSLITAMLILIVAATICIGLISLLWGKAWNRQWKPFLGTFRTLWIVGLSLLCSWSLVAADSLYGSHFFKMSVSDELSSLAVVVKGSDDEDSLDEIIKAKSAAHELLRDFNEFTSKRSAIRTALLDADQGESGSQYSKNTVLNAIYAYNDALVAAWGLCLLALAVLVTSVAFVGYSDIKEIKPH